MSRSFHFCPKCETECFDDIPYSKCGWIFDDSPNKIKMSKITKNPINILRGLVAYPFSWVGNFFMWLTLKDILSDLTYSIANTLLNLSSDIQGEYNSFGPWTNV